MWLSQIINNKVQSYSHGKFVHGSTIHHKDLDFLNETTGINLTPGQAINYDSINDSIGLDAAASVDRRVGSHFQNQRLNSIHHQYHLQRSPVSNVQNPQSTYSRYE